MKCPVCGSENKSTALNCYRCGSALQLADKQHGSGAAQNIWGKKSTSSPPPSHRLEQDLTALDDEVDESFYNPDLLDEGAPLPDNLDKLSSLPNGEEITVVVPKTRRKRPKPAGRKPHYHIRWGRFCISLLLVAGLCAAVGYGGVLLYRFAVGGMSGLFSKAADSTQAATDPIVEKVLIDGSVCHKITFFGQDQNIVMLDSPRRSLTIENGKAELLLDDAAFVGDDVPADQAVIEVNLDASLFDAKGNETVIHVPPYTIEVPLSPLKLVSPQMQSFQTNEDRVVIKIKVEVGSRVLIGTKNVTDIVSKDGYVSASVNVDAIGVNTIPITVETPLHRTNVFELKIDRPAMAVPITLDESVAGTSETRDGVLAVSGGTEPGATVTTNASLSGEMHCDTETGAFKFTAQLTTYGWNAIEITSTTADGRTSTMVHRVKRTPDLDSYSKQAWAMDYSYLSTAPKALLGKVFVFNAQVIKDYDVEDGDYYLVNIASDDGKTQFLVVENTQDAALEVNKAYQFYADVTGVYSDYPLLTARFIYETTAQAFSTPSASPAP